MQCKQNAREISTIISQTYQLQHRAGQNISASLSQTVLQHLQDTPPQRSNHSVSRSIDIFVVILSESGMPRPQSMQSWWERRDIQILFSLYGSFRTGLAFRREVSAIGKGDRVSVDSAVIPQLTRFENAVVE